MEKHFCEYCLTVSYAINSSIIPMQKFTDNQIHKNITTIATVSIVKADRYEYEQVYNAVKRSVELIGGLKAIIKPGSKVFVKINHLSPPTPAEKGIVTNPLFVEAVLNLLKGLDIDITVGDDLSSYNIDGFLISGFRQMCEKVGVRLTNLREGGFVEYKCHGYSLDNVYFSKIVLNADIVVNLPKLKTHSLTTFTGGVKNMYGVIPGSFRSKYHGDYSNINEFSQVLVDVYSVIKPHLTIMDAIIAMEGEGPASGKLRNLGIILSSRDAVALDAVATSVVGINPKRILTTQFCNNRQLGVGNINQIEIVGEKIADVSVADFKPPLAFTSLFISGIPSYLPKFLIKHLAVVPHIIEKNCTGCSECETICPTGAITVTNRKAAINKDSCIDCMCCHEVCRFNAIVPRRSIIGILFHSGSTIVNILRSLSSR